MGQEPLRTDGTGTTKTRWEGTTKNRWDKNH